MSTLTSEARSPAPVLNESSQRPHQEARRGRPGVQGRPGRRQAIVLLLLAGTVAFLCKRVSAFRHSGLPLITDPTWSPDQHHFGMLRSWWHRSPLQSWPSSWLHPSQWPWR